MPIHWVVMGVSACGKSSFAQAAAQARGWGFLEGDDFHSPTARARMAAGQPLSDAERGPWVQDMARALQMAQTPALLSASMLRRRHREQLRLAVPGLRFAHLQLPVAAALARASSRAHFFPPALIESQFASLEPTEGEADVLALDALLPMDELLRQWAAKA